MRLLNHEQISVPLHTSTVNSFPQSMFGHLVLNLLKSCGTIAVLH